MVDRKNLNKKYALISVYNKKKLGILCKNLREHGYDFISTGSTGKTIKSLGFKCKSLSKITNFREILDGRVKTLNPKIFGSILYKRNDNNQVREFNKLKTPRIDILIVNLYPFKEISKNKNEEEIIEMIDIGGSSLIRAASKNFNYVTVIPEISDYLKLIKNLNYNNGITDINFRKKMAAKSFKLTSEYDNYIYNWFENKKTKHNLRYGENPDQKSYIISKENKSVYNYQLNGKKISYNNIIDIDSGLKCLNEFKEPSCVIIKHTNPCGVSSSDNILKAFKKAYECNKKSAFGGIVLLNKRVNLSLAKIISKTFFEVIVALDFEKEALNKLSEKKKLIILKIKNLKQESNEVRSTIFGNLYQTENNTKINRKFFKLASNKDISKKNFDDLIFATKVVKHLKSNAIVLAKNKQTVGLGMGQTNRYDSVKLAIKGMKENFNLKNFVCSSDAFFPFSDGINLLKKNKCNIIAQPSGSINDSKIINFAKDKKISLYFLKNRLFKH